MVETILPEKKEARAVVRYIRISPRKVRLVINTIRHKPVSRAVSALSSLNKKAARLVEKGLKSAMANAKVKGLEESRLMVSEVRADGGPMFKRFMSRSMGRADQILKRTTHLTIVLQEVQKSLAPPTPEGEEKKAKKAPVKEKLKKAKAAASTKKPKKMAKAGK